MLKERTMQVTAVFDSVSAAGGIEIDLTDICGIIRALYVDFPAGADASTSLSVKTATLPQGVALTGYTGDNGDGWLYPAPLLHRAADGAATHYDAAGTKSVADEWGGIPIVNEKLLLQVDDSDCAADVTVAVTIIYEEKKLSRHEVVLIADGYDDAAGATVTIPGISGYFWGVYLDYECAGATPVVEIYTLEDTQRNLLTVSGKTDAWKFPRMVVHDDVGAARTYDTGKSVYQTAAPLVNDTVSVALTSADNGDTVRVVLLIAEADLREVIITATAHLGHDGAASGFNYYTGVTGKLISVELQYNGCPATTDIAIAVDTDYGNYPDMTLLTVSNNATDGYWQPSADGCEADGTPREYESGDYVAALIPLYEAGVTVTMSQSNAGAQVKARLILER